MDNRSASNRLHNCYRDNPVSQQLGFQLYLCWQGKASSMRKRVLVIVLVLYCIAIVLYQYCIVSVLYCISICIVLVLAGQGV